jgi:hypothetical protein
MYEWLYSKNGRLIFFIDENRDSKIVNYTQLGLLPDDTHCACCPEVIETESKQKRIHILMGCGCKDRPLVCSRCRHKYGDDNIRCRHYCQWCQKPGLVSSFINERGLKGLVRWNAKIWFVTRWQHQHVAGCLVQRVLANWNLFSRYREIVTQEIVPNSQNVGKKVLAQMFFRCWIQNQLKKNHCKISIFYGQTRVDPYFLKMLRNGTFTKVVIRNLFRVFNQKMMNYIHRRVLANFNKVFEFSLNY